MKLDTNRRTPVGRALTDGLDQEELAAADYRDQFAWIRTLSGGTRS